MAVKWFEFGSNDPSISGEKSSDHGLYISGDKTFNSAEKEYEKVSVPGRDGDLIMSGSRFKNVNLTYHGIVIDNYEDNTAFLRSWLLSGNGYKVLRDNYHPDEYRLATFSGPMDFSTLMLTAGETDITFDCKPQRWLNSGARFYEFNVRESINNETMFAAKPIIRVHANYDTLGGEIMIGNYEINISPILNAEYVDIDCDLMNCHHESSNYNDAISVANSKWPVLEPITSLNHGKTIIDYDGDISKIEIMPRWWKL